MKRSILFVAALFLSISLHAQQTTEQQQQQPQAKQPLTAEEIAKKQAEHMKQRFMLGEDQYDKVYKACLKRAQQQVERRKQMEAEKEAFAKDMKGILNETQYAHFEKAQQRNVGKQGGKFAQRRGQMQGRGGFARGFNRGKMCPMAFGACNTPQMQGATPQMRGAALQMQGQPMRMATPNATERGLRRAGAFNLNEMSNKGDMTIEQKEATTENKKASKKSAAKENTQTAKSE